MKIYKNKKLTEFARGQECTLNIAGVCNYNSETSVWCHFNLEGGKMGGKTDDLSGGIGCSSCHDALDGRVKYEWCNPDEKYFYMARSMKRSLLLAIENGVKL